MFLSDDMKARKNFQGEMMMPGRIRTFSAQLYSPSIGTRLSVCNIKDRELVPRNIQESSNLSGRRVEVCCCVFL